MRSCRTPWLAKRGQGELGGRYHGTIVGVVAPDVIGPHLGRRRPNTGDPHRLECVRQPPAPVSDCRLRCESGDRLQSRPNEAIPGRVDRQLVEAARHSAAREELAAHRREDVDAPAHATDDGMPSPVAEAELAALPLLDGVRQDFGDEVRQLVGNVLARQVVFPRQADEVGCVQHEKPKVTNRNSAHIASGDICRRSVHRRGCSSHHPSRSWWTASPASAGESNQYSARRGWISVSTTCLNQSLVVPAGASAARRRSGRGCRG